MESRPFLLLKSYEAALKIPRIPAHWLPAVLFVVAVVVGCIIGPALFASVSPGTSTIWDWLGSSKEQLLTIGTIALAIATYALFRKTADMAIATRLMAAAAQQDSIRSDRQHQQILSGQLGLNNATFDIREPDRKSGLQRLEVFGTIRNVGGGPALDVRLYLAVKYPPNIAASPVEYSLGVIPGNGKVLLGEPTTPGDDVFRVAVYYAITNSLLTYDDLASATIRLEWRTLFGSEGFVQYLASRSGREFTSTSGGPDYVPLVPVAILGQTIIGRGDRLA